MDINILLDAAPPIPSHALVALGAAGLGAWQLAAPKRGLSHQIRGGLFVAALAYVALSALFITGADNRYSWIHLLIPVTLFGLVGGVFAIIRRDRRRHGRTMIMLFAFALLVTGLFTFYPGRIMHDVLFGAPHAAQTP